MTTHPHINISHVPEILRLCAKNQITPFFLSNPGIGKTQQVEAYAKEQRAQLIVLVASLLDRTDFQFPLLDKEHGTVRFVPLEELKHLSVEHNPEGEPVILYWNEMNSAPESLFPVLYRLINERKLGKLTLRANVMQLADGNPTVASSVANELPHPAKRRFSWFLVRADFEEWMTWAQQQRVHPLVTSFIQCHPQALSDFDPNLVEAITYASPAGYERLSKGLDEVLTWPDVLAKAWFCGAVGQSAGTQFYAYVRQKHKVDGILRNLQNPESSELPAERDLLYLLCALLINRAAYAATEERAKADTQQLLEAVAVLAKRILEKSREHGVYLIKSLRRNPDTTAFFGKSEAHQILVDSIINDPELYEAIFG
jgi:hypothetical protein